MTDIDFGRKIRQHGLVIAQVNREVFERASESGKWARIVQGQRENFLGEIRQAACTLYNEQFQVTRCGWRVFREKKLILKGRSKQHSVQRYFIAFRNRKACHLDERTVGEKAGLDRLTIVVGD